MGYNNMRVKIESNLSKKVDANIRGNLADHCHYNDGSISDLIDVYDDTVKKLQGSFAVWAFDDRPSRIYVKAYHITLQYFGYERNSLP